MSDNNAAVLMELGEVKGQLTAISDQIRQSHEATQTRIEDLSKSVGVRIDGIDKRLSTVEQNERNTAIRTAGISALTSAIVAGAIAGIKNVGQ